MQLELPEPDPENRSGRQSRRASAERRYVAAHGPAGLRPAGTRPTSLSPIVAESSVPPKFLRDIASHNELVRRVDVRLRMLEQMPVGAALASRLFALRGEELGVDGAIRVTALWTKIAAWADAEAMLTTREALNSADFYVTSVGPKAPLVIGQEIACATRVALSSAMAKVHLTTQVADTLPKSWVALDRGDWTLAHVRALARATQNCPPRTAGEVEARIVPEAIRRGWTPAQVGKHALRLILAIDPDGAAERAASAKANSDVTFAACPDETATVTGYGDAAMIRRIWDTLNAAAAAMGRDGDERSVGQRRVDALAEAVLGRSSKDGTALPAAQALIGVPVDTILGSDSPGELAGYGPICASTARALSTDAMWRKLILDPGTGEALDIGMRSYRPSEPLLRYIQARDWTCTFFGCNQPAIECDCDHRKDHHAGGPTSRANLQLLCRTHHNLKTCKLWTSLVNDEGQIEWTSPLGHVYTVEPHRLLDLLDEPPPEPAEPVIPYPATSIEWFEDPDPPWPDEPPPITIEQFEEYLEFLDSDQRNEWFRANDEYDQLRRLQPVS